MTEGTGKSPKEIEKTGSIGKPWQEGEASIGLDQICFVRAIVDEKSIEVAGQEIRLPTLSTITKGEYPRFTNHWAINHLVKTNFGGSWAMSKAVVISPAEALVDKNGLPENLAVVDTFWTKDMTVPGKTTIIFIGNVPDRFNNLDGIKVVSIPADDEKMEKIKKSQLAMDNHEAKTTEEEMKLENDVFWGKAELDAEVRKAVDEEIRSLGYTVLDQEAMGVYMHEKGLDEAIYNLSKEKGIGSSRIHSDTLFGQLEHEYFSPGPLELLVQSNSLDELEKLAEDHRGKNGVRNLLANAEEAFNEKDWKWTDSEKRERLIFSAELYKVLRNSSEQLKTDERLRSNFVWFFKKCPEIKNIIISWSKTDSVNLDSILVLD